MVYENLELITSSAGCRNRKWHVINLTYVRYHKKTGEEITEVIENLGVFDSVPNRWGQKVCGLNVERIKYWLACGVKMSKGTAKIFGLAGITPLSPDTIFQAKKLQ